jgi:hypothetical protein
MSPVGEFADHLVPSHSWQGSKHSHLPCQRWRIPQHFTCDTVLSVGFPFLAKPTVTPTDRSWNSNWRLGTRALPLHLAPSCLQENVCSYRNSHSYGTHATAQVRLVQICYLNATVAKLTDPPGPHHLPPTSPRFFSDSMSFVNHTRPSLLKLDGFLCPWYFPIYLSHALIIEVVV